MCCPSPRAPIGGLVATDVGTRSSRIHARLDGRARPDADYRVEQGHRQQSRTRREHAGLHRLDGPLHVGHGLVAQCQLARQGLVAAVPPTSSTTSAAARSMADVVSRHRATSRASRVRRRRRGPRRAQGACHIIPGYAPENFDLASVTVSSPRPRAPPRPPPRALSAFRRPEPLGTSAAPALLLARVGRRGHAIMGKSSTPIRAQSPPA